jgi:hypothetical protein
MLSLVQIILFIYDYPLFLRHLRSFLVQLDFRGYKPIGFVNPDEDGRKLTKLDDFLRQ